MNSILKMAVAFCLAAFGAAYFITHGGKNLLSKQASAPPASPNAATSLRVEPSAATAAPTGPVQGVGAMTLTPDQYNQYHAEIELNGRKIPALVDTGASMVALRAEDAEQLGIYPAQSEFTLKMSTANGIALAAPVKLSNVRLGNISVNDVPAIVAQRGAMTVNLLGMTFLKKLSSFEVAQGKLILHQ